MLSRSKSASDDVSREIGSHLSPKVEKESDKLWLFKEDESRNYLYMLKENETTLVELTELKRLPKESASPNSSNLAGITIKEELDLDSSASTAKLTTISIPAAAAGKGNDSSNSITDRMDYTIKKIDKKKLNSQKQQPNQLKQQNSSNGTNKNKLNSFFKNSSKKLPLPTFLHSKSKRLDVLKPNNSRSGKISHRMVHHNHPFLPRAIPSQPLLPFTGNHHLLFGSQIPLPGGYFDIHPGPDDMMAHPPNQIQSQSTIPHAYHQSLAHQNIDYHRQTELTPIFFTNPSRTGQILASGNSGSNSASSTINNNNSINNKNTTPKPVQNKTRETSAPQTSSNFSPISLPLGAAAAALFSERAKNFISHLNRGSSSFVGKKKELNQKGPTNNNTSYNNNNTNSQNGHNTSSFNSSTSTTSSKLGKGIRDLVTDPANSNGNINTNTNVNIPTGSVGLVKPAPDNLGLASMIKNAADSWATSNPVSEPSIIVEHDGPAITTVDFGPNHNIHHNRLPVQPEQGGEDEVVNSFYEGEDEESYVEGSNEAKRFVKMKHHHQLHNPHSLLHQHQHHHHQPRTPTTIHQPINNHHHHHHTSTYSQHYPFEEQDQSHTVQTEVPLDSFYNNVAGQDYTGRTKKTTPYTATGTDHYSSGESQFNDYTGINKLFDQTSIYPDSINAIKEQNNANDDKISNLLSSLGANLGSSNSEQIELLIKELQKLNKSKQQPSNSDDTNTNNSGSNQDDNNNNNNNNNSKNGGTKKAKGSSSVSDDYEDLLASNEDDEDEKLKVLRKKLLARLRSKTSRKRGNSAGESFHNEAIKIPLHALLLAALDRRMSPSELSQTVLSDLIEDDANNSKKRKTSDTSTLITARQQDFNEVSSGLGSLIGYDSSHSLSSTTLAPHLADSFSFEKELNASNLQPLKEPQDYPAHTPNMFILNNIRLPDHLSTQKNNDSTTTTFENTIDLSKSHNLSSDPDEQLYSLQTTRLPLILHEDEYPNREYRSKRNREEKSKKRRELDRNNDFDDFDVNRQVEEFARDKPDDTSSLEPKWSSRRQRGKAGTNMGDKSVHFDDDFDELAKATRRKILKRRRKPLNEEELDAELRFFNKMQRDTSTFDRNPPEFDKNLHDVEDPIGLASQERNRQARRLARAQELDDDMDNNNNNNNRIRQESPSSNDDNELEEESRRSKDTVESTWKPQMIDEEVRKIEKFARSKERAARDQGYEPSGDYSDNEDGRNQVFEEAESCDSKTTVQPENIIKVTIDSPNGTGARIMQRFRNHQATHSTGD